MVVGSHLIDSSHLENHSLVVQTMSVRILMTIAHKNGLRMMSGDVGNAFLHEPTQEKVFAIAGKEFGERTGCKARIDKALHRMATSSRSWSLFLSDFTRSLDCVP